MENTPACGGSSNTIPPWSSPRIFSSMVPPSSYFVSLKSMYLLRHIISVFSSLLMHGILRSYINDIALLLGGVSVNSFLDTFGPKIMRHPPRHIVAHVAPGQGLCSHAVQSATSHCIDAGTRAALGGVLPQSQRL